MGDEDEGEGEGWPRGRGSGFRMRMMTKDLETRGLVGIFCANIHICTHFVLMDERISLQLF
jgi:hypothetical protein